jgi:citrate synthase
MLWLLLTGQVPEEAQVRALSRELAEKGDLPPAIEKLIDSCVNSLAMDPSAGVGSN